MISDLRDKRMLEYGLNRLYPGIFCFSTTRHGGYSLGGYASFNCTHYSGDSPDAVEKNRRLLCTLLPEKPAELLVPHQVHGTKLCAVDEEFAGSTAEQKKDLLEGVDALVTHLPGECLCVSTADCIPVLCYDVKHRVVGAIHAGWRGTLSRIVGRTLGAMHAMYGTRGEDVVACIGPGISCDAFEVGDEVYGLFAREGFDMRQIAVRRGKWHIDLWEANRRQLLDCGVPPQQIETAGICTWQHNDDFFSARRQGIASGRILSGIMILRNM